MQIQGRMAALRQGLGLRTPAPSSSLSPPRLDHMTLGRGVQQLPPQRQVLERGRQELAQLAQQQAQGRAQEEIRQQVQERAREQVRQQAQQQVQQQAQQQARQAQRALQAVQALQVQHAQRAPQAQQQPQLQTQSLHEQQQQQARQPTESQFTFPAASMAAAVAIAGPHNLRPMVASPKVTAAALAAGVPVPVSTPGMPATAATLAPDMPACAAMTTEMPAAEALASGQSVIPPAATMPGSGVGINEAEVCPGM